MINKVKVLKRLQRLPKYALTRPQKINKILLMKRELIPLELLSLLNLAIELTLNMFIPSSITNWLEAATYYFI